MNRCGLNTIFLVKKNEYIGIPNMFFNIKNFYLWIKILIHVSN